MPSRKTRPWTEPEMRTLQRLAQLGYPCSVAAQRLGRSIPAVQQKASEAGISFGNGRVGRR
jgi:hypothetical protein